MLYRISFVLITIVLCVCYANIGGTDIYILDEAKNASCAKEMFNRGDMIVPTFNGQLRGDKPPLHYFFMMAAYQVFGISSFAARFFSALMGCLMFAGVYFFAARFLGQKVGRYALLCGLATLLFMFEFHLAVPDPYLVTFLFLANVCLFAGLHQGNGWLLMSGYMFLALGILAKGPVAIVLPGIGWVLYLLLTRTSLWPFLKEIRLLQGGLLVLIVAVPWFAAVHFATDGAWTYDFFIGHNLDRFTGTREGHGGFPLASVVLVIAACFPIGVFIPRAGWYALRRSKNPVLIFCTCLGLAPVLFFLFSKTILPNYIMPAIPFFLVVIGAWWQQVNLEGYSLWPEFLFLLLSAIVLPFAFRLAMMDEAVFAGLENYGYYFWILAIGIVCAIWRYRRGDRSGMLWSLSLGTVCTLLVVCWIILPQLDERNPVNQSRHIWQHDQSDIVYFRRLNPAYVFYLDQPVSELEDISRLPTGTFVISRSEYADTLNSVGAEEIFRYRNIFESGNTIIYRRSAERSER